MGMAVAQPLLGVDSGDKRVGIALKPADSTAPEPIGVFVNDSHIFARIEAEAKKHDIDTVIVGLPRNIEGNDTLQTGKARGFAGALAEASGLHVILYDEFDTSVRARQRLGAKTRVQEKDQLDAYAAAVLLSDYLESMV